MAEVKTIFAGAHLPQSLHKKLSNHCKKNEVSRGKIIKLAIIDYLNKSNNQ